MRVNRRLGAAIVAGLSVIVATIAMLPSNVAGASSRGAPAKEAVAERARQITLITGDRLTVVDGNKVAVTRAPGRADIPFLTRTIKGHRYAIPVDALPLLRSGRLDPRLFDLTLQIEYAYDRRPDVPLIVQYAAARGSLTAGRSAAASALAVPGVKVTRDLPAVRGLAVRAGTHATARLWSGLTSGAGGASARSLRPGVGAVWLDGLRQPTLDVSVPQIGAPAAWTAGFDGTGQSVAVLDTGVDVTHPDLADRVAASANFTEGEEDDLDRVGHGTHVASTIVGSGAASGGRYTGVAKGARLLNGKVCVAFGCAESWILAGMQWAAEQGASVVNMSLGGGDTPGLDPLEQAVEALTAEHGTLFVVAAGNAGPGLGSVSSPSTAPAALSVAAVTKTEEIADFSGRGLTVDNALKPEISAPGVEIVAARGKDGFLGEPGELYMPLDGTSMATPHVAGAAAILHQRHPDWTPAQLKAALMGSAAPNAALATHEQGAGRVDVARAIAASIVASPPGVSFGLAVWPHTDDEPITKTVTYTNLGTTDRTLNLSLTATGPDGQPTPPGAFTVTPASVTVPAGGAATVSITADTRIGNLDGLAGGRLTATAGDVVVQTPFSVNREVESYEVTFVHTNRDGTPASEYITTLFNPDDFSFFDLMGPDGTVTRRIPKGRYLVASLIVDTTTDPLGFTFMMQPRLDVTGPQTVRIDARRGRPVKVTVPNPAATQVLADVAGALNTAEFGAEFGLISDTFAGITTAQIGPNRTEPGFLSRVGATFASVRPDGDLTNSRFAYLLTYFTEGRFITGFKKAVKQADLATIRADHLRHADGAAGDKVAFGEPVDIPTGGWAVVMPFELPFARTEYYSTEGVRWTRIFDETVANPESPFPDFVSSQFVQGRALPAGSNVAERWNHAAFGPTLADPPFPELWASRFGDTILVAPPIFGDGAGHQGYSLTTSERTVVTRDGTVISDEPFLGVAVDVPPGPATYRVAMRAERGAPFDLATVVDAAWTFRSSHVDGDAPRRLPLSVVRFTPPVDRNNAAPAGQVFLVPLAIGAQPGSSPGAVASLSVDVSYDDGASWRSARVVNLLGHRFVLLQHPDSAGYVSLRTRLEDTRRTVVEQTVIHAYRIAPRG
jgi:subtilisin family serine protease